MSPLALLGLPAIPAASALLLAIFGASLPYAVIGGIATLAAGLSFAIALGLLSLGLLGTGSSFVMDLGPWLSTNAFQAGLKLRVDSVGLCMVLLVTFFGFLITAYSVGYMRHDREQSRFFASLNLFVASMLTLVLSDNLALIFLGWEGVGLCSYLLIGHYWDEAGVPLAAFRAFFVNRIGDLLFILGVFTVFTTFGTLSLSDLSAQGSSIIVGHEKAAFAAALFLLGGAFAKSAQAPLHVWLADAMAGPTPVSALIHAATMVTAGIYLIMRLDWLYGVIPEARFIIGVCALITLVIGAFMALTQTDIKKILAYSTLSNLALMFLGLAAGSSSAAMQHLFGHAFFKALLFLAAGSVILAAHHEQDVRKLQGVLKTLPITRIAFWVGCIGGAGLIPFFSAGFFTKEAVLDSIRESHLEGFGLHIPGGVLYTVVLIVESLSALYMFRLLGYLSSDNPHEHHDHGHHAPKETSPIIRLVLAILAVAAPAFAFFSSKPRLVYWITGGRWEPETFHWAGALPSLVASIILAVGCFAVFSSSTRRASMSGLLTRLTLGDKGPFARKFYFDDLYAFIIVSPLKISSWIMRLLFENIFIGILHACGWIAGGFSLLLRRLQSGQAHRYAGFILLAVVIAALFLLRS